MLLFSLISPSISSKHFHFSSFFGVATSFVSTGSWFCVYIVGRFSHIFLDFVLRLLRIFLFLCFPVTGTTHILTILVLWIIEALLRSCNFCASIWQLIFSLFLIISSWCVVLLFVLITMKSSWVIALTFFTHNSLGACLCWIVTWNKIIAPKTEFIFCQVPASSIHTELNKFLIIIHIIIFLTHMTWASAFFLFPCYVCLDCISFHFSVSMIWPLFFVRETVKSIYILSPVKRVCYKNCLFLNKVHKIYKFCIPLLMSSEIEDQSISSVFHNPRKID